MSLFEVQIINISDCFKNLVDYGQGRNVIPDGPNHNLMAGETPELPKMREVEFLIHRNPHRSDPKPVAGYSQD